MGTSLIDIMNWFRPYLLCLLLSCLLATSRTASGGRLGVDHLQYISHTVDSSSCAERCLADEQCVQW